MDISTYWQTVKKQSKELTGVDKISTGIFSGSGIGSSLEEYIKAVKGGDEKKILKAAQKAWEKSSKYLQTIHKKEVAQGKKALSPAQMKSAKIVGDALDKIVAQLEDVITGDALAGSFDGDGQMDAKKSAEPLSKELEKDALAFIKAREDLLADAKKVLAHYQKLAKPVAGHLKLAERGVAEAKKAKAEGKTFENQQGIDLATRAVFEIEKIHAAMQDYDEKVVKDKSGPFMQLRGDYKRKKDLPSWYVTEHTKKGYDAWKKVEAVLVSATDFIKEIQGQLGEARALAEQAESHSMKAADPAKLLAKLKGLPDKAQKLFGTVELELKRIKGKPSVIESTMRGTDTPTDQKLGAVNRQAGMLKQSVERVSIGVKTAKTMRKTVEAIGSRSDDKSVAEAVKAVIVHLDAIDDIAKGVKAATQTAAKAVADARIALANQAA